MKCNELYTALEDLKKRFRPLCQDKPIDEYKKILQAFIKVGESINADIACKIIQAYPILENWKMFQYLAEELKCLQERESYSNALRTSFQKSSVPREVAYVFFSHELADSSCLMNESEIENFNSITDKIRLYRGADGAEYQSGSYNVSWTSNVIIAIYFAFFAYPNREPYNRVVLASDVKKRNLKAQFDTSVNHGPEDEKIVLLEPCYPTEIYICWEDYSKSGYYEDYKILLQKKYPTQYNYVMGNYIKNRVL